MFATTRLPSRNISRTSGSSRIRHHELRHAGGSVRPRLPRWQSQDVHDQLIVSLVLAGRPVTRFVIRHETPDETDVSTR